MHVPQRISRTLRAFCLAALLCGAAKVARAQGECQPTYVFAAETATASTAVGSAYIESMSIGEQYAAGGAGQLVIRVKLGGAVELPSDGRTQVNLNFGDVAAPRPHFVAMTWKAGRVTGFTFSGLNGEEAAEPESNFTSDGMITIVVAQQKLRARLAPGDEISDISAIVSSESAASGESIHASASSDASYIVNGPCPSDPPPVHLANIAGRSLVRQGDYVGIGGFIVAGPAPKRVIIRAIGPSLKSGDSSLSGRMQNPTLEVRSGAGELIGENDDWRTSPQAQQIRDSGLAPKEDREAAVIGDLAPGGYTAIVRGANGTEGIAVVEIYDLQAGSQSELANLASRAFVSTGDNVLIGGFIVGGGTTRVLMRAIGSSLAGSVADELEDPTIEVTNAEGVKVADNDNWRNAPNAAEIEATGAAPTDEREAAAIAPVSVGSYTAVVRGARGSTGVGVVEIYRLE